MVTREIDPRTIAHLRSASTCSHSPTVIDRFLLDTYTYIDEMRGTIIEKYILDISNFHSKQR